MTYSAAIYLETADRIGRRLCRDAVWDRDQCTWFGWSMEPVESTWAPVYRTVGIDLYGGISGIGLFLARLSQATHDAIEHATACAAARRADEGAAAMTGSAAIGSYSGLIGIGSALVEMGTALGDERWIQAGLAHVRRAVTVTCDRQALDVIGGSAGAIPVLIDLGHRFGEVAFLDAAVRHAKFLQEQAIHSERGAAWDTLGVPGQPPLLGYSHGAAGIVTALLEVAALTGDHALYETAREGLRYESSYYSASHENWPDLRTLDGPRSSEPVYSAAWCHGAPGIGLARLRADALLGGDPMIRTEIMAAARTTTASLSATADFSLCHGTFGNAEFVLELATRWHRPDFRASVLRTADRAIDAVEVRQIPWPCGVPEAGENPSLLLGTAGIGHFFLRLADPRVPSMLLRWPAQAR